MGIRTFSQCQQGDHPVIYSDEMTEQVDDPVLARSYLHKKVLILQVIEKFVRPSDLNFPCLDRGTNEYFRCHKYFFAPMYRHDRTFHFVLFIIFLISLSILKPTPRLWKCTLITSLFLLPSSQPLFLDLFGIPLYSARPGRRNSA